MICSMNSKFKFKATKTINFNIKKYCKYLYSLQNELIMSKQKLKIVKISHFKYMEFLLNMIKKILITLKT